MMRDCHIIFDYVKTWLHQHNYPGPLILMGRSLGSASVLELAFHYQDRVDGLIVESGFAYVSPLLRLLTINLIYNKTSRKDAKNAKKKIQNPNHAEKRIRLSADSKIQNSKIVELPKAISLK